MNPHLLALFHQIPYLNVYCKFNLVFGRDPSIDTDSDSFPAAQYVITPPPSKVQEGILVLI